jgi:hypothetical protein
MMQFCSGPLMHFLSGVALTDDAWEFRQHAVTGVLYSSPAVLFDLRVNKLTAMQLEPFVRSLLIGTHQPRVARDIGGEDRRETAFDGLFHNLPQPRQ